MKKVFIISNFKGDIDANIKKALYYGQIVIGTGRIPVVPYLYFKQFLNENNPNEKMKIIDMGLELMEDCDEVYLMGFDITEGMEFELDYARGLRIPVCLFDADMNRINIRTLRVDERATPEYCSAIRGLRLVQ